jgi:aconitate hydratase
MPTEALASADYVDFAPDRVACQDATAQMVLLHLCMQENLKWSSYNSALRSLDPGQSECSHRFGESQNTAMKCLNSSVSNKYGIGFWKPEPELFIRWC